MTQVMLWWLLTDYRNIFVALWIGKKTVASKLLLNMVCEQPCKICLVSLYNVVFWIQWMDKLGLLQILLVESILSKLRLRPLHLTWVLIHSHVLLLVNSLKRSSVVLENQSINHFFYVVLESWSISHFFLSFQIETRVFQIETRVLL